MIYIILFVILLGLLAVAIYFFIKLLDARKEIKKLSDSLAAQSLKFDHDLKEWNTYVEALATEHQQQVKKLADDLAEQSAKFDHNLKEWTTYAASPMQM
jgi:cell division protein FtsL